VCVSHFPIFFIFFCHSTGPTMSISHC
jgi:hypothetical protein